MSALDDLRRVLEGEWCAECLGEHPTDAEMKTLSYDDETRCWHVDLWRIDQVAPDSLVDLLRRVVQEAS